MAQELSDRNFKISLSYKLKSIVEKICNMQEQMEISGRRKKL